MSALLSRAAQLSGSPVQPAAHPAAMAEDDAARRRAQVAWSLLFLNVLSFGAYEMLIPIPSIVAKLLLQGALLGALLFALSANPRVVIRPSGYVLVLSVLASAALMASIHSQFFIGSTYRAFRLITFVLVLWLLTPWFDAPGRPLLRAHLRCLGVVLGSVAAGMVLSPGKAFAFEGRLSGIIWPIPATQVAHYGAAFVGISTVMWLSGRTLGRLHAGAAFVGVVILLLTHTRTALVAMLVGILIAGLSLFLSRARVRKAFASTAVFGGLVGVAYAPAVGAWLSRGQNAQEATQLTGRTKVWHALMQAPRSELNRYFGCGLSNKSFAGLPIDSSWFSTYQDQGLFGIACVVAMLLGVLVMALTSPRGPRRAIALFIVAYSIVASVTETGLGDASPYLLDLAIAASLVMRSGAPA